jgi:hypothetical protein
LRPPAGGDKARPYKLWLDVQEAARDPARGARIGAAARSPGRPSEGADRTSQLIVPPRLVLFALTRAPCGP